MILLVKLILAHLIGDFLLQPYTWVKEKELKKLRSPKLYIHVLLHGLLVFLLVWDLDFWLPTSIIVVTHFMIDSIKLYFQKDHNRRAWLTIDQVLHFAVIFVVWNCWQNDSIKLFSLLTENHLIYLTAAVAVTFPASVFIKTIISKWTPHTEEKENESLENAGKYIGVLERLLVLAFVISGQWQAVGFLIAAKSVFRFGDLKESKDLKLTEYILIGTLLSFGIALAVGMIVNHLLSE